MSSSTGSPLSRLLPRRSPPPTSSSSAAPATWPSASCCPRSTCATATASCPAETRIVASSRAGLDDAGYRDKIRGELPRFVRRRRARRDRRWSSASSPACTHVSMDIDDEAGWPDLAERLAAPATGCGSSTSPSRPACSARSAHRLDEHGLVTPTSRVVLEKPIGHDLASARAINDEVGAVFAREPDLPHRPLPRQGERAEPAGDALRQHLPRAAVERQPRRPRADHRRRVARRRQPRAATTTTPARCATWCRTTCCSCSAWSRWSRRRTSTASRARREAQGAPAPSSRSRRATCDRHACAGQYRAGPRRRRRPVPSTATSAERPGSHHRDLRRDQGRDAELALGRRAVLPAHRQADGPRASPRS